MAVFVGFRSSLAQGTSFAGQRGRIALTQSMPHSAPLMPHFAEPVLQRWSLGTRIAIHAGGAIISWLPIVWILHCA